MAVFFEAPSKAPQGGSRRLRRRLGWLPENPGPEDSKNVKNFVVAAKLRELERF